MKKMVVLGIIVLSSMCAHGIEWTNAAGDNLWSNPGNWNANRVPGGALEQTWINGANRICIVDDSAYTLAVRDTFIATSASYPNSTLKVVGGYVQFVAVLAIGQSAPGILKVSGGKLDFTSTGTSAIRLGGAFSDGIMEMTGGEVNVAGDISVPHPTGTGNGQLFMYGGVLNCRNLNIWKTTSSADFTGQGLLAMTGDRTATFADYIVDGRATAYGGMGDVVVTYDPLTNRTFVTGVHMFNPTPKDGGFAGSGSQVLEWTLPDPNHAGAVVTCDVYCGTDPNIIANPMIVNGQAIESVPVLLESDKTYYWQIITYQDGVKDIEGPIFMFNTTNKAPEVFAGVDTQTWLKSVPMQVQLSPIVTDDGRISPLTYAWTIVTDPSAENPSSFLDPSVKDAVALLQEAGTYVLQLDVNDGEFTISDTIQITVFEDACAHAAAQPGFGWLAGDINRDCMVNIDDFADMAATWLMQNYTQD